MLGPALVRRLFCNHAANRRAGIPSFVMETASNCALEESAPSQVTRFEPRLRRDHFSRGATPRSTPATCKTVHPSMDWRRIADSFRAPLGGAPLLRGLDPPDHARLGRPVPPHPPPGGPSHRETAAGGETQASQSAGSSPMSDPRQLSLSEPRLGPSPARPRHTTVEAAIRQERCQDGFHFSNGAPPRASCFREET